MSVIQDNSFHAVSIDGHNFYDVVGDLCEIADLTLNKSDYFSRCFEVIGEFFYAGAGILNLRVGARTLERSFEKTESFAIAWLEDLDSLILRVQTDEASLLQKYTNEAGNQIVYVIAAPILTMSCNPFGAVGMVIPASKCVDGRTELALLTQLLSLIVVGAPDDQPGTDQQDGDQEKSLQSVVRASDYRSIHHLCFAIANSLCSKLNCEQITIGLAKNRDVKLIAVSGLSEVPGSTPGMQAIRQAMATCLDRNEITVVQEEGRLVDQCESSHCKVHHFWHKIAANSCIATIPLRIDGQCVAVIALRRKPHSPFVPDDMKRARILAESFAPALPLVDRASRSMYRHGADSLSSALQKWYGWHGLGRKMIASAFVLAAIWAIFGKTTYEVLAPCKIVAKQVTTVASPFDGQIEQVFVRPGQSVKEGQLLVRFDNRDLFNERNRILTQIASTRIETNAYLQKHEPQEAFLLQSKLEVLNAELQLISQKLTRSDVYAQSNGVILPSEIHRRVGQFVTLGEPLLEVANEKHWHLEIETPENQVRHLEIAQIGEFQSRARPDRISSCKITDISPSSQVVRQKNVVLAHALMQSRERWMKIGMEGHVRVNAGDKPVWWVYLHPVIDYTRLQLWL